MQKNWYILYTKPKCEKKVSHSLTRKKIENFCPQTNHEVQHFRRSRVVSKALFESYVFVKLEAEHLRQLLQLENVINIVYWKNSPAIIAEDEIEIMKNLLASHKDVTAQRTRVDPMELAVVLDKPGYTVDGNVVKVINRAIKVNLPSIGFKIHVALENHSEVNWVPAKNKELLLQ